MTQSLHTTQLRAAAPSLRVRQTVLFSGIVYTARDAAHQRIAQLRAAGGELPFALDDAVIYYAGPTPARPGQIIGSCGPTTSGRMDPYTPALLDDGVVATIGKGARDAAVCAAICRNQAVYFCAIGGAGALAARCVRSCQVVAFPDLGCESVKRLELVDFPLVVAVDCAGGNLFCGEKTAKEQQELGIDR